MGCSSCVLQSARSVALLRVGSSWPGLEPMSSALAGRFLTTRPPEKRLNGFYYHVVNWLWLRVAPCQFTLTSVLRHHSKFSQMAGLARCMLVSAFGLVKWQLLGCLQTSLAALLPSAGVTLLEPLNGESPFQSGVCKSLHHQSLIMLGKLKCPCSFYKHRSLGFWREKQKLFGW